MKDAAAFISEVIQDTVNVVGRQEAEGELMFATGNQVPSHVMGICSKADADADASPGSTGDGNRKTVADAALRNEESEGEQIASETAETTRSSLTIKTSDATYYGQIEDVLDAKLVIEACIKGVLMQVNDVMEAPSISIRPGTVLVIHELEGSIQRWRDGYLWSPSRLYAGFLIYRNKCRGGGGGQIQATPNVANGAKPIKAKTCSIIPGGLTKKTIGIVGSDRLSYRVISYYENIDPEARVPKGFAHKTLPRPSHDDFFASLELFAKGTGSST
ncbi:Gti1/Pac2 family-domain-containing protein [Chytriomyces cf. hyalinus JEL632]|nr:Gti1/Pac2 family-domain-containing protein [Chytriomyces cf. hyalinus JEL632]